MTTVLLPFLLLAPLPLWARFELATPSRVANIHLAPGQPGCVRLAAEDLAADVRKIAGRAPRIAPSLAECGRPCVSIVRGGSGWERYRVAESSAGVLRIEGSDERGMMFGIYAFIEQFLEVDPLYFWTGREPKPRATLAWDRVLIESGEPSFRYRGWFVNDEDLLTEWEDGGGKRDIDYPFYHQVTAPAVLARVYEAALRLQYNLIIPASFTDIANPAEERMIRDATRRGLMVSMHHVEPMGVSAFAFNNYWRARGRQVPYTFHSQRAAFEEVWRHFAAKWAQYPGVVWQLGLRGVADRPAWHSDPTAPQSDEARGQMISDAMALQWEIVRSVDQRPHPPATTTLWMEGAELNRRGYLRFPKGVAVVFADNTPGWKMQADFYDTPREPGRDYGIYYHHAVWGWGPHFVQAVPPWKTYEIFAEARRRGASHYAVLNVANVREFPLGLAASSEMLRRLDAFDPRAFLTKWCAARFGPAAPDAERAYRAFFDAYVIDDQAGTPALLDGLTLHEGERIWGQLKSPKPAAAKPAVRPAENIGRFLPGMRSVGSHPLPQLLEIVRRQSAALRPLPATVAGEGRDFFETNFAAQRAILLGLLDWVEAGILATQAIGTPQALAHARQGAAAFARIRAGQAIASRGKWKDWYRGDRKMNLARAEALTRDVVALLEKSR